MALFTQAITLLGQSRQLRVSLARWLVFGLAYTEGFCLVVAWLHGGGFVEVSLGGALWWAFVSLFMVGGAPLLVIPGGGRLSYYGIPNGLSAMRAWSCLPLLLTTSLPLPGNLGLILWCSVGGCVGMLDYVDGLVARSAGPITELGQAIDPAMDALFFSVAAVSSWQVGIVPLWLAILILVRYMGPMLATPVVFLLHRRPQLVHTGWGRRNTALVGLVVFVLMWFRIFGGPVDTVAVLIGVPLLVPTMLLHFWALGDRVRHAPTVSV